MLLKKDSRTSIRETYEETGIVTGQEIQYECSKKKVRQRTAESVYSLQK